MSSICGIYKRNNEKVKNEELHSMIHELNHWGADYTNEIVHRNLGFGHLMLYNTPESHYEKLPYHDKDSGLLITADARIDNREELMRKISLKDSKDLSDSQLILEAFKMYNRKCLDHLVGAFAFVIWDENRQELFCARDHIGFKPFHYYMDNFRFIFGTEIKHIINYPGIDVTLNEQFITDALATLKSESTETLYKQIKKIPPAHYMVITRDSSSMERYWDLNPGFELKLDSEEAYIEQFLEKLNQAVKCRLRSNYPVGAELSGGIDSSAVTGIASQYTKLNTFSHTFPDWALEKYFPHEDEREFINQVNSYCRVSEAHQLTGEKEGIITSLKNGVSLYEGPIQGTLSLFSDPIYKKAGELNNRTLLSGFGGDELVSYQGSGIYKEWVYKNRLKKLIQEIKAHPGKWKTIKKTAGSMMGAYLYKIKKIAGRNPEYKVPKWAHDIYRELFINPDVIDAKKFKQRFFQHKRLPNDPDIRWRQYRRFHYSYFPIRLENCYLAAQARRVEYRYPLLDKRLLEFYLSLPSDIKIKNGWGRYTLRKSLDGLLPEKIQWRNDKVGNTIPSVNLRLNTDYDAVQELIEKARNSDIKHYIEYDKALKMLERMAHRTKDPKGRILPMAFYNALMLLIYQLKEY